MQSTFYASYRRLQKLVRSGVIVALLGALFGCSANRLLLRTEGCKNQTDTNLVLENYISTRFVSGSPVRMAIVPFDVPETFATWGNESEHFGRQLARRVHAEIRSEGVVPISEIFNRDRWPGKREEFFTGNYQAIELAKNAGYDLVLVGYMDDIKDDEDIDIYTKIIDTHNHMNVWSARTRVTSKNKRVSNFLARARMIEDRPELFAFPERVDEFATCVVQAIKNKDNESESSGETVIWQAES
jgi:hypothetical protein